MLLLLVSWIPFTLGLRSLTVFTLELLLGGLLLQREELALCQVLEVDLAVGQTIFVHDNLMLLLVGATVRELVDLVLDEGVGPGRLHEQLRVVNIELALASARDAALLK